MWTLAPGHTITPGLLLGFREQGNGNDDGFGIWYPLKGRIVVAKTMSKDKDTLVDLWEEHQAVAVKANVPISGHFRRQTKGGINIDNCHPFPVTTKEDGDKYDVYGAHNGTFPVDLIKKAGMSDSYNYFTYFLGPLLKETPALFTNREFWLHESGLVGVNKLILMRSDGKLVIVNSQEGKFVNPRLWGSKPDTIKIVDYKLPPPVYPEPPPPSVDAYDITCETETWMEIEKMYWEQADGWKHLRVVDSAQD